MATQVNWATGVPMSVGPAPYPYIVTDIETANAAPEEVKAHFEKTYRTPRNYKEPKKIAEHREKAWASASEIAALHPCAPVIAIGLKTPDELRCLHCMREHPAGIRMGGLVEGFANAQGMLEAYANLIGARTTEETALVGFNIRDFDLPALRRAMARMRMPIPAALLNPDQPLFDNMVKYCRLFSGTHDIMMSAPEVSAGLGIEPHGVSGAVVPELHAAGDFEAVIDKVLLDVIEEEAQFLRMTGRA